MDEQRVLVLGGYGAFGRLICESLVGAGVGIVIAGRDAAAARDLAAKLGPYARSARIDLQSPSLAREIAAIRPLLVINTAGPFQGRDYAVPRACVANGIHYVDLADGRAYVAGIGELDADARAQDVLVTSGASTCPALSTAIVDDIGRGLRLDAICFGIAPGLRQARGPATARAVLARKIHEHV